MGKEYNLDNPETEMDCFVLIEGLGGLIYSTARGVRREHISEESGAEEISELVERQNKVVSILKEKFNIIFPPEGPHMGNVDEFPDAPEGKQWYWAWYYKTKEEFLKKEYEKIICSGCALSTGDMDTFNREIPCSAFHGSLFKLRAPYYCGMIPSNGSSPDSYQLTREDLLKKIERKGGEEAVQIFLKKEEDLKEIARRDYQERNKSK